MIAVFPRFTPIDLELKADYDQLVRQQLPYSDFNFASLFSANWNGLGRLSVLHGNVVLLLPHYVDDGLVISFLGNNQPEATATALLTFAKKAGLRQRIEMLPDHVARPFKDGSWQVTEDVSSHDYILSLPKLANPIGPDVRRFRQTAACFERRHVAEATYTHLDLTDGPTRLAIFRVFFERHVHQPEYRFIHQRQALQKLFAYAAYCPLRASGVTVGGRLKAFIIIELLDNGWSIAHCWKADTAYAGIYSWLLQRVAAELSAAGTVLMNFEQDLGLAGLRQFKRGLAPIAQLKKWTVQAAPPASVPAAQLETLAR